MNAEVIAWTIVFLGGDLIVMLALIGFAMKKDREKARTAAESGESSG